MEEDKRRMIAKWKELFLGILYPRRCPVCDDIVVPLGQKICPSCRPKVKMVTGATCLKCGKPLRDPTREYCYDCLKTSHKYDRGFSVFLYRSVSGSIYRFKYLARKEYADYYAEETERLLGKRLQKLGADAIIPVPMYEMKRRQRGYNQAEVLAKAIGNRLQIPVKTNVIKRVRNTAPMKGLDAVGRRNNLKKAFIVNRNELKLETIIIIDDIYTTGSTMDEIAGVLKSAGVRHVYCLSLAIGQG